MAQDKPTLDEILSNPDEKVKDMIALVDSALEKHLEPTDIDELLSSKYSGDEELLRYGNAYLDYKVQDWFDGTDKEEDEDDEFNQLLNLFISDNEDDEPSEDDDEDDEEVEIEIEGGRNKMH